MKKYTIMPVLMLAAMTVNLNAAQFMTAARALALTRMPIARVYSTVGTPAGNDPATKEPIGNEWHQYASNWHHGQCTVSPANIDHAQKKIRILNALIRNKDVVIPAAKVDYEKSSEQWALTGAASGTLIGIVGTLPACAEGLILGASASDVLTVSLICGGLGAVITGVLGGVLGIPFGYIEGKLNTNSDRKYAEVFWQKARNQYQAYVESPEKFSTHYNAGLIQPMGDVLREPLPPVVLNDLYAESVRTGRIQE